MYRIFSVSAAICTSVPPQSCAWFAKPSLIFFRLSLFVSFALNCSALRYCRTSSGLMSPLATVFPGDAPSEPEKSEGRATREETFRQRAVRSRERRLLVAVVSPVESPRRYADVALTRSRILAPLAVKKK